MGLGLGAAWLLPLALAAGSSDLPLPDLTLLPDQADIPFSEVQHQVRVQSRVIVRITPLSRSRDSALDRARVEAPRRRPGGAKDQCIPLADIAGVRLGEGRNLLLYLRNRRVVGTSFDRGCQVSNFYSGFYVERPQDGLLCAGREALHSRSGAECMLGSFHELVPDDE